MLFAALTATLETAFNTWLKLDKAMSFTAICYQGIWIANTSWTDF